MSRTSDAMLFLLSLNIASMILSGAGFEPMLVSSTVIPTGMNSTRLIPSSGSPLTGIFVFWDALITAWDVVVQIVLGFPLYMYSLGVPSWLYIPIGIAWSFIFFMWALHLATGRETGD